MKKFLLVLGMLTCLFGLTACGKTEADVDLYEIPLMSEDEAKGYAEQLIKEVNQVVEQGMAEMYASDAELAQIFGGWTSAMEEMGEYQGIIGYEFDIDSDSATIVADIQGSERNGKVTIKLDNSQSVPGFTVDVTKTMGELMTNAALNTLLGMGTVFCVLILIMLIISMFKIIYNIQQKPKKQKNVSEKAVENTIAQIIENEELSDDTELVAVIAAAIAASEGATSTDGFVVRSIRRANTNKWQRA